MLVSSTWIRDLTPKMILEGSASRVLVKKICILLVDLRLGFGRCIQLLQVYRSGSTRSVFIGVFVLPEFVDENVLDFM